VASALEDNQVVPVGGKTGHLISVTLRYVHPVRHLESLGISSIASVDSVIKASHARDPHRILPQTKELTLRRGSEGGVGRAIPRGITINPVAEVALLSKSLERERSCARQPSGNLRPD